MPRVQLFSQPLPPFHCSSVQCPKTARTCHLWRLISLPIAALQPNCEATIAHHCAGPPSWPANGTRGPFGGLHRAAKPKAMCDPKATVDTIPASLVPTTVAKSNVCFSNWPVGVKRYQTVHGYGVDVTHGLVLLFGIGTKALPSWDSRTRRNNLLGGLAVKGWQVQADIRSRLIRRPARDILPPLGGTLVFSYRP